MSLPCASVSWKPPCGPTCHWGDGDLPGGCRHQPRREEVPVKYLSQTDSHLKVRAVSFLVKTVTIPCAMVQVWALAAETKGALKVGPEYLRAPRSCTDMT